MTERERILAVYKNEKPDKIPYMLDLSHWFYHKNKLPWDLSKSYDKPEKELIDYHKKNNIGFYLPNLASFYETHYPARISSSVEKNEDSICWKISTPTGTIKRVRIWEEKSYAWGIPEWGVKTEKELIILGDILSSREFMPKWQNYKEWVDYVGDIGVVYLSAGYSAMGQLLNYWMGIEETMYAICDWPETVKEVIEKINRNNLTLIDMLCESPAEIIIMGDNFSSDVQPPSFFKEWSRSYYTEAIRRLHSAGKYVAVHIDGRLKGALKMFGETGADCADAVTPKPTGDITPRECREDAGEEMILSGGIPPALWLSDVSDATFQNAVISWLELSKINHRLIANAGDQVPPNAIERRIKMMREIVDSYSS